MKKVALFLALFFSVSWLSAQSLQGSWERSGTFENKTIQYVYLFSGDYFSWTAYYSDGGFIATKGGHFMLADGKLKCTYEFNTADPDMVGMEEIHPIALKKKQFVLDNGNVWKNTDGGKESPLTGPWLMAGRKTDGKINRRDTSGPRKTMKILTPTRFQWIAYNTDTKQFLGTGGGTYTAENGRYTENIQFFSRDSSRVGVSLPFNFEVQGDDWHHSGNNSRGEPMYEVWAKRKN